MPTAPVYELEVAEVFAALDSAPSGLLPTEAAARRELYGRNELRVVRAAPLGRRLLLQLRHPMPILLLAAGLVAMLGGKPGSAAIVWAVVVVNEAFAFWQGYRAERAIDSLRQLLPAFARVERGGARAANFCRRPVPRRCDCAGRGRQHSGGCARGGRIRAARK